jgi:hypothetical protein
MAPKVGENGFYENNTEYARDLIRRSKERAARKAFDRLKAELTRAFAALAPGGRLALAIGLEPMAPRWLASGLTPPTSRSGAAGGAFRWPSSLSSA